MPHIVHDIQPTVCIPGVRTGPLKPPIESNRRQKRYEKRYDKRCPKRCPKRFCFQVICKSELLLVACLVSSTIDRIITGMNWTDE